MSAQFLLINHFCMAGLARLMTGMRDRVGSQLSNGIASVVTVLAKGFGHHGGTEDHEGNEREKHDSGQAKKVFDVPEQSFHLWRRNDGATPCA
jgi:hypothetical protein